MRISRRDFIRVLSTTAGSAYAGTTLTGCSNSGGGDHPVIVLGAGLAGLAAAYELMNAGHEVVVLEARTRVGGRIFTVRDGFTGSQYAEGGAIRIPDVHLHTLGYAAAFGLPLAEFPPSNPIHYLKGERFTWNEGDTWPATFAFNATEEQKGLRSVEDYINEYFPEVGDATDSSWPLETGLAYDSMNLVDFLRSKGATEDFITLYRSENGSEIDRANSLAWLSAGFLDRLWDKTYTLDGGMDQLPVAFEQALGDRIRFDSPVLRIEQGNRSVTVTYGSGMTSETLVGSHVICTLPTPLLREVEFSPALSDEKRAALMEHTMSSASRIYFATQSRFWEDEGVTGLKVARTDLEIERLWDPLSYQGGTAGMLTAYLMDENADAVCARGESDLVAHVEQQINQVFPMFSANRAGPFYHQCWKDDPWAKGGWSTPEEGQGTIFLELGRAEGRIHFAGEHTSIWNGWMNGSFESAKRAAAAVEAAVNAEI